MPMQRRFHRPIFLNRRFSRKFPISNKFEKKVSDSWRPENTISDIVMAYSFFFYHILYHTTDFHILWEVEPPRPIFGVKVLKNDVKN